MDYNFKLISNKNLYPYNLAAAIGDWMYMNADTPLDCLIGLNFVIETTLTEKEKRVIKNRFEMKKSYKEISSDISEDIERVRLIEAKALRKLRNPARYRFIMYGLEGEISEMKRFNELSEAHKDAILMSEIKFIYKQYEFDKRDKRIIDKLVANEILHYADLYKILVNNPKDLLKIKGIGKRSAEKIIDFFNQILGLEFNL